MICQRNLTVSRNASINRDLGSAIVQMRQAFPDKYTKLTHT